MADDQSSKARSIDDLVRELSKNSTSPVTPSPSPQPARPSFPTSKPSMPPPMAGSPSVPSSPKPLEMPKPQFRAPPPLSPASPPKIPSSPSSPGSPTTPPTTPGVKEYQSSIRTMNEDISKLKQGQKPMGIDVPRKVEQIVPVPPQPISRPIPPLAGQVKPNISSAPFSGGGPSQLFKVPSVNLDQAQKPGPVVPRFVPNVPKVEPKEQIYVPQEERKGINRNILFMGIGAAAVVAGFSYWFFVLRSPTTEIVQETPTPTPIPTATPIQDLNSILLGISTENISVKDPATDLNTNIKTLAINGGEFKNLNIISESKGQFSLGLLDFLAKPDQQLVDNMGADHKVLLYGQKEIFDSKGQLKTDAIVEKRLVFVNEVKDVFAVPQLVKSWEASMNEDFKSIFEFDPKKQQSIDFADNQYGGVGIRYKNFKYSDRSIDYAIVPASNGKSYLVITGSRESMYATIDKLKGF